MKKVDLSLYVVPIYLLAMEAWRQTPLFRELAMDGLNVVSYIFTLILCLCILLSRTLLSSFSLRQLDPLFLIAGVAAFGTALYDGLRGRSSLMQFYFGDQFHLFGKTVDYAVQFGFLLCLFWLLNAWAPQPETREAANP